MNMDQARFNMVEQQIRPWDVLDPKILDLFMEVPRHQFVTEAQKALAYSDLELPIGMGQFMLPPRVEARILQALDVSKQDAVLEIGTGSGFTTALLAASAKRVTSVEIHPELQEIAKQRLTRYDNIEFVIGDASQNWEDGKQYDVIFLTGSTAILPEAYKQKLNLGGRLAATVGSKQMMTTMVLTRISEIEWETETLFETSIPALIHAEAKEEFKF